MRRLLTWTPAAGPGFERAVVLEEDHGVFVRGVSVGPEHGWTYQMRLSDDWRTLWVEIHTTEGRELTLSSDGEGAWYDAVGTDLEALDGPMDVDFAVSPLTNSLPIKRLLLPVGQTAEVDVLYVGADLALSTEPQRYTHAADGRWRFESLDGSGFSAEIEVDAYGFVVDYPGLFRKG